MAYVNALEWKADQVAEWLQGLDDAIYPYTHYFVSNNVTGKGLLDLTVEDLRNLHVAKIGHQEIILEGLEHLRNLQHNLDTENLQYVCLKVSCKARSLCNEILRSGSYLGQAKQTISTETMCSAADVLDALSTLVLWLDRPPFSGVQHYDEFKKMFLKIGIDLAVCTQRDTFAEQPLNSTKQFCQDLAALSDTLIRDVNDSIILQPACLDIATAKRRTEDENFGIVFDYSSPSGVHLISEVKFQSPAHQCGRIQPGDEIVQINYQTVVGWHVKKVIQLMDEYPSELIITLKKRPRHLPMFGQIYIKPFRIPARKNDKSYFQNLQPPRAELLVAPKLSFPIPEPKVKVVTTECDTSKDSRESESDEEDLDICDDDCALSKSVESEIICSSTSIIDKSPTHSMRSVLSRPRSAPQRRATISGSAPSHYKPYINISEIWSLVPKASMDESGSKASTLMSNDSGRGTIEEYTSVSEAEELRKKTNIYNQPRPKTMSMSGSSSRFWESADSDYTYMSSKSPLPLPPPPPIPSQSPIPLPPTKQYQQNYPVDALKMSPPRSLAESPKLSQVSPSSAESPSATNTRGSLSAKSPPPIPPPLTECETEYVNLDDDSDDIKKQPVPKPRKQQVEPVGRKKPIPQPRRISSDGQKIVKTLSKQNLTAAFHTLLPEPKKEVVPVPSANFKSFKKYPESATALPDYINTTPPPPPQNPPPPLEPRMGQRQTPPKSQSVILRPKPGQSPSNRPHQDGSSPQRFGMIVPETVSIQGSRDVQLPEAAPPRTPYYMSDVFREVPPPTPERTCPPALRKDRSHNELFQVEQPSHSPPPIPDRLYDIPYQHKVLRTPSSKKSSNA